MDGFQRMEAAIFGLPSAKRAAIVAGHTAVCSRDWPELWVAFSLTGHVEAPTVLAAPPPTPLSQTIERCVDSS